MRPKFIGLKKPNGLLIDETRHIASNSEIFESGSHRCCKDPSSDINMEDRSRAAVPGCHDVGLNEYSECSKRPAISRNPRESHVDSSRFIFSESPEFRQHHNRDFPCHVRNSSIIHSEKLHSRSILEVNIILEYFFSNLYGK